MMQCVARTPLFHDTLCPLTHTFRHQEHHSAHGRALGFVSLFVDLSSEVVHALLPVFLVTTMGMSVTAFGVLEGAAEATALIVKVFSGPLCDSLGRRKGLLLLGYGLAALTKPLFPLASSPAWGSSRPGCSIASARAFAARRAMRWSPTWHRRRSAARYFGLRQSMDTIGAFLGPALAIALMFWFADHIRTVLWFAVVPAFIAIGLIAFCID